MVQNLSNLTEVKDNVFSLLELRKYNKIVKIIINLIIKRKETPLKETYDIIGELTQKDPETFLKNIFPILQSRIFKILNLKVIHEWNEYILKNYCFLEGEELILSFTGDTYVRRSNLEGLIYLTNYRLINVGTPMMGPSAFSIFDAFLSAGIESRRKGIRDSISKLYTKEISTSNIGEWGYMIPIINAYKINKEKKKISYVVKLDTGKHSSKYYIEIIPFRSIKFQTKEEFIKQREEVLHQIQQQLLKHQNI